MAREARSEAGMLRGPDRFGMIGALLSASDSGISRSTTADDMRLCLPYLCVIYE